MVKAAEVNSMKVGEIRLTYLPDGDAHVVPEAAWPEFPNLPQEVRDAHNALLTDDGCILLTLGAFLVETGDRRMLFDLGIGNTPELDLPNYATLHGGKLLSSLMKIGLQPADITDVCYSHLHADHVGWTVNENGEDTFPNARLLMHRNEWEQWDGSMRAQLDYIGQRDWADHLGAVESVIRSRVEFVEDGECFAPGVNAMATFGHTAGHLSFVVSSGQERAIILGDTIACGLSITAPELDQAGEVDSALSRRSREHLLRELEQPDTVTAGGHFPEVSFGRVMRGEGKWTLALA